MLMRGRDNPPTFTTSGPALPTQGWGESIFPLQHNSMSDGGRTTSALLNSQGLLIHAPSIGSALLFYRAETQGHFLKDCSWSGSGLVLSSIEAQGFELAQPITTASLKFWSMWRIWFCSSKQQFMTQHMNKVYKRSSSINSIAENKGP